MEFTFAVGQSAVVEVSKDSVVRANQRSRLSVCGSSSIVLLGDDPLLLSDILADRLAESHDGGRKCYDTQRGERQQLRVEICER